MLRIARQAKVPWHRYSSCPSSALSSYTTLAAPNSRHRHATSRGSSITSPQNNTLKQTFKRYTSSLSKWNHDLEDLHDGRHVSISGWIISLRRISKSLAFAVILLPRGQGRIQVVARTQDNRSNHIADTWEKAGIHGVVRVDGILHRKPQEAQRRDRSNDALSQFEIASSSCSILNSVTPGALPFDPFDPAAGSARDEVRMRYRYLDLRGTIGENIRLRSKVSWAVRDMFHKNDFTEIETPVLLPSTPEGAREYLVPVRSSTSQSKSDMRPSPQFYALQQSPQQPKQLLVASGVTDRYFQFAKCFRDEDGRRDRQPEFTQIDVEMGFVQSSGLDQSSDWTIGGHEVRNVIEDLIRTMWAVAGTPLKQTGVGNKHFPVMQYREAMERYGSDKPDLRYGMQIVSLQDIFTTSSDERTLDTEVELLCFSPPQGSFSRKYVDDLFGKNKDKVEGVERFSCEGGNVNTMAKVLLRKSNTIRRQLDMTDKNAEEISVENMVAALDRAQHVGKMKDGIATGEKVWIFVAQRKTPSQGGSTKLGEVRQLLWQDMIDRQVLDVHHTPPAFVWIIEFPLFTQVDPDKTELFANKWNSTHHPFTSPKEEDKAILHELLDANQIDDAKLHNIHGQHYDLVVNGVEIGGGSVRIHDAHLQQQILAKILQLPTSELSKFTHLLDALSMGAPPHAGIALGFDRIMAILCNTSTIRDVIAFPKSANGRDLLFTSPSTLDEKIQDTALAAYALRRA